MIINRSQWFRKGDEETIQAQEERKVRPKIIFTLDKLSYNYQ